MVGQYAKPAGPVSHAKRKRSGMALPASLAAITAVSVLISGIWVIVDLNAKTSANRKSALNAILVAEAGNSHGLALLGFVRHREIGIDLEKIRPEVLNEGIAENFFAPTEVARIRSLPAAERCDAFFECWTRKEAYVKARGEGLSHALDSFEVSFGPGTAPAIQRAADEDDARSHWTVVDLTPAEGYVAALVVER